MRPWKNAQMKIAAKVFALANRMADTQAEKSASLLYAHIAALLLEQK
jgi:hypothetical protein